ncbi:uncharacterized protein B0H64DRAFT_381787 [Chaetomium fimeti]|uniref:Uncharacterized protein n=1 Tax=Chaetomium fimeti TaxID=1854472 RepID=A0AAE0HQH5_9PEZI|nr:hypothetical protein B0H64DRAFT_381787 [Chaetomium fimeti]
MLLVHKTSPSSFQDNARPSAAMYPNQNYNHRGFVPCPGQHLFVQCSGRIRVAEGDNYCLNCQRTRDIVWGSISNPWRTRVQPTQETHRTQGLVLDSCHIARFYNITNGDGRHSPPVERMREPRRTDSALRQELRSDADYGLHRERCAPSPARGYREFSPEPRGRDIFVMRDDRPRSPTPGPFPRTRPRRNGRAQIPVSVTSSGRIHLAERLRYNSDASVSVGLDSDSDLESNTSSLDTVEVGLRRVFARHFNSRATRGRVARDHVSRRRVADGWDSGSSTEIERPGRREANVEEPVTETALLTSENTLGGSDMPATADGDAQCNGVGQSTPH